MQIEQWFEEHLGGKEIAIPRTMPQPGVIQLQQQTRTLRRSHTYLNKMQQQEMLTCHYGSNVLYISLWGMYCTFLSEVSGTLSSCTADCKWENCNIEKCELRSVVKVSLFYGTVHLKTCSFPDGCKKKCIFPCAFISIVGLYASRYPFSVRLPTIHKPLPTAHTLSVWMTQPWPNPKIIIITWSLVSLSGEGTQCSLQSTWWYLL